MSSMMAWNIHILIFLQTICLSTLMIGVEMTRILIPIPGMVMELLLLGLQLEQVTTQLESQVPPLGRILLGTG